jgi:hypothetical protein
VGAQEYAGKHVVNVNMPVTSLIGMRDYLNDIIRDMEMQAQANVAPQP